LAERADAGAAGRARVTRGPVLWGVVASVVWVILSVLLMRDSWASTGLMLTMVAVPLAGIWLAVVQARALVRLRAEAGVLREALEGARTPAPTGRPAKPSGRVAQVTTRKAALPDTTTAPAAAEAAPESRQDGKPDTAPDTVPDTGPRATFASGRGLDRAARRSEPQATLPFGADAAPPPPLPPIELIRALHFPETADDTEGFRALRRALKHEQTAQVVQAAQDMLTLLSQDGIYMDDLTPDRARPELWRRFAEGERGGPISAVGGIRDARALTLCTAKMRENAVFRDAAHHFLRRFDRILAEVAPDIDDETLAILAETRSARAFMLLGRTAGMFD
jgi:hypothetical protein